MFLRRRLANAPVFAGDEVVAVIFVSPVVGVRAITEQLGPWLALGAALLLVGGTAVGALLVFRPAHAHLRALEEAARRFGEGDLTARAPTIGGDEVAAVAVAFNRMADDLGGAAAAALRGRPRPPAAARRRVARADDAAHGDPRLRRDAHAAAVRPVGAPDGQRYVHIIQEEVERIERLVGDLLDLARYEAAGVTLVTEDVRRVGALRPRGGAPRAGGAREAGDDPGGAARTRRWSCAAIGRRLEQALQNLASNALRHTPAGGRITLSRRAAGRRRRACAWPTPAPASRPSTCRTSSIASTRPTPRAPATGSGLGLSIVKAIVERHGGRVLARSAPGAGTVFEIELPR